MRSFVLSLLVLGCGQATMHDARFINGFDPPAPGADQTQVIGPPVLGIAPGANITYCSYLDVAITGDTDVVGSRVFQSPSGHHAILYVAKQHRPVDTHVCNEDDMINVRYLAGGGSEPGAQAFGVLPDGVAFRIPAGAQLMMQTHWINASRNMLDGQAVANLTVATPSPDRVPADLFSVANTTFVLPAGKTSSVKATCAMKKDLSLFLIAGHEHQLGTNVVITQTPAAGQPTMLYQQSWLPEYETNPPVVKYMKDAPLVLKQGDTFEIDCSYDLSAKSQDVAFPNEMCVGWGFYFPGGGEIDCVDGSWPN